ncbi:hypothetical protein GQ600_13183 [Phytophthora cactorum]|nr:hypothetical protein GQ600_13183 [Phytophthora cactorum]
MDSEPTLRRSKREHQPSAKAAASSASTSLPPTSSSASRRSQRRRVTLSPASPASSDLVSVVVDAVGPNGQRRRVRAAAHTGSNSSVTQGVHSSDLNGVHDDGKVLGRYSSHDCALLCEVILGQLKKQTLAPTVLDEVKSPAFIKWEPVARKMETTHKLRMTPRQCQMLWKFLAYGDIPVVETDKDDELLADSDEEDFHKTAAEINPKWLPEEKKQHRRRFKWLQLKKLLKRRELEMKQKRTRLDEDTPEAQEESEPSLRLYPTYSLPTGAPDAWYRPFGPKDALPLTFVASRFLRRKPTPPLQTLIGKSAATGQPLAADLKRKQAGLITSTAAKKPKLTTPVSTPPRVFTPSSTPPPAAKRARSDLEFFELHLQRRFDESSVDVRHQCQLLAAHDVERFNREVVRLRIWQKAMGTTGSNIKPAPKPAASPSQTSGAKPVSTTAPAFTKSSGPTPLCSRTLRRLLQLSRRPRTKKPEPEQKDAAANVKPDAK